MAVPLVAQRASPQPVALVGEDVDDHVGLLPGRCQFGEPAAPANEPLVVLEDDVGDLTIGGEDVDVEHEQRAGREVRL
jgi:hypothetical protein